MARFLIGEISTVFGIQKVFNKSRPNNSGKYSDVEVDESNTVVIEFENGAVGTIEASCINAGRKNQHIWEIYGSKGSMFWDLEDLNNLYVNLMNSSVKEISGFTKVNVTDPNHPFSDMLWPPGHLMGWESGQVNEIFHFVDAVVNDKPVEPYGATFHDGYMVQLIMDSINKSNMSGKKVKIKTEI